MAVTNWLEIIVGGGAGIYLTHVEVSPEDDASTIRPQRITQPSIAAGGLLGFEIGLGPGALVLEAQYTWVGFEKDSAQGNVGGLAGFLGYRLAL